MTLNHLTQSSSAKFAGKSRKTNQLKYFLNEDDSTTCHSESCQSYVNTFQRLEQTFLKRSCSSPTFIKLRGIVSDDVGTACSVARGLRSQRLPTSTSQLPVVEQTEPVHRPNLKVAIHSWRVPRTALTHAEIHTYKHTLKQTVQ